MKAEEVLKQIPDGAKVYYNRDRIIALMKDYARIQIEKDREDIIDDLIERDSLYMVDLVIKNRPITLD